MRTVKDCKVAVVGGAGFLGSHLVDLLVEERGCDVLVLDNLCAGRREFVHERAEFVHADITGSEHFLLDVFRKRQIRYVLNFAAWPYVPTSFDRPLHVFDVNCFGAIKVINAAQEAGVEAILQVSSAEVYGGPVGMPPDGQPPFGRGSIDEQEFVIPHSSYGASKAAVDAYCQVAWRERKTPVIALRQFNCLGERETHPYVVPEIIGQLHKQMDWIVRKGFKVYEPKVSTGVVHLGNNTSRDFLYAGDAVRVAVELLERGEFGQVYNSGSEDSVKMYDLAERIGRLMGFSEVRVERDEARVRPWDIWSLKSDNTKIRAVVGVRPDAITAPTIHKLTLLDEALRRTIDWHQQQGGKWPWER